MTKPIIAVTIGDPNGVGPEVALKALAETRLRESCRALLVGPPPLWRQNLAVAGVSFKINEVENFNDWFGDENEIAVIGFEVDRRFRIQPGKMTAAAGAVAAQALELAAKLALQKKVAAVVTAPLSKKSLQLAGYDFPGQTEFLAEKTCAGDVVMVLLSGNFRVGLATTHCAIQEVSARLSREIILRKLKILQEDLCGRFRIPRPRIAVCALNPHAGEEGLFGSEESKIIRPAISDAQALGIDAVGPLPADTLFARVDQQNYDAYLAMYHDQGLIPLKMKSFGRAVNYTAGLNIIRTSPDHGTAFDIAGQGAADPGSMMEAIKLAVELAAHSTAG
jgi:4-hydroxythreonine-4-phosphate dehydrogenase